MDFLRKVPIGQYIAGNSGWMRRIDPRLKFAWVLMFLLSPVLASYEWRVGLVVMLLIITFLSRLPVRSWLRSLFILLILAIFVGCLSMFLPTSESVSLVGSRSPKEYTDLIVQGDSWEIMRINSIGFGDFSFGPFIIDRRSAGLGLKTSTLIFTVIHSVNLMLITTSPEDLVWALRWFISPLAIIGIPIDRLSFQLLLSLRFLPLIQEEFQNLLRSLATRAVNLKSLGFKAAFGLCLSVGERLLANILLRAEQGADSLIARKSFWITPEELKPERTFNSRVSFLNFGSSLLLLLAVFLRGKYGTY